MVSEALHAVTVRRDAGRDTKIELAVALPPDRSAGTVTAIRAGLAANPSHRGCT